MDSSISTGDPWDLPDQEPEPSAAPGGISSFAESTGLFSRVRSSAGRAESDEGGAESDESESTPAVPSPAVAQSADEAVESVESVLHELESEPPSELVTEPVQDTVFDLVPPPSPEESAMFETYSPDLPEDTFDDAAPVASTPEVPEVPDVSVPPASVPPVEIPPTPVYSPPAGVVEQAWEDPTKVDDFRVGDIEFGDPQTPEGAELPTGKATRAAGEGAISRPVLLTTDDVGGANLAPVDIVVAVESVTDASHVPAAIDRVLDALRDRCAMVGGEAVVSVRTEISAAGSAIMVTASGTAVNLL